MNAHLIRFRGGWEWATAGAPNEPPRRVTLPIVWPPAIEGHVRLLRWFQRPPYDPAGEQVLLQLDEVVGLRSVRVNDREILHASGDTRAFLVVLDTLGPRRNLLALDVNVPRHGTASAETGPWGAISLVIRPLGDGSQPLDFLGEPADLA